ncbi:hypothetical protein [Caulobacter sp. Root1472]|uniref:hypothetical protein n=1 Tax=Caulobacter sp. Root1472 TaxID=1736470 RepID=UPI0006FEDFA1|nr:hypothetical protein [Caulobacter sp. Root1472]KQZ31732.1 hypothetical protein ASD47_15790 [Caulobacter sp. Root1472]
MIVVFFAPASPGSNSGPIVECVEATEELLQGLGRPFKAVSEFREDWNFTHEIVDDQVVPRDPELLAALRLAPARKRLKVLRDALLADNFDAIRTNPERWDPLSAEQQQALLDYRQALLRWPASETDPLNPTPPTPPEL